jgi:hypothetical protein
MHPYLQRALSSFSPKGSLKNFVEAKQYLALCTTLKEPDISQEEKRVAYILLVYCYLKRSILALKLLPKMRTAMN